jgi:hypothetical protein
VFVFLSHNRERKGKERAEEKKDMSDDAFALFAQLVFVESKEEKSFNHGKRKELSCMLVILMKDLHVDLLLFPISFIRHISIKPHRHRLSLEITKTVE